MKKYVVYFNLLVIAVLCFSEFGCNDNGQKGMLILPIPDYAIGMVLSNTKDCDSTLLGNLKQLREYDNDLHKALHGSKNKSLQDFTITKKINPCCPCAPGMRGCCQCPMNLTLAAPTTMNVSITKDDGSALAKSTLDGVDLFTLTADDPTTKVTVSGNGISQQLDFSRQ